MALLGLPGVGLLAWARAAGWPARAAATAGRHRAAAGRRWPPLRHRHAAAPWEGEGEISYLEDLLAV